MSDSPQVPDPKSLIVVGLGASAGGLRPLEAFFEGISDETGAAFVVIQHLSPDFESMMEQLLGRRTRMKVVQATNGMVMAPNQVFLIPRRKEMRLADGKLWLTDRPGAGTGSEMSMPIDVFFKSMALAQGPRCIALLLSGAGSDGALGIQAVRGAGGLVAVQTPQTAQFDLMPKAAIATHEVDEVLPPDQMPGWVEENLSIIGERAHDDDDDDAIDPDALQRIARLVRQRHGVDFTAYKRLTLGRRIERRMVDTECATVEEYAARLTLDEGEVDRLFRDLLIGVSAFFRDEEAFAALRDKVVPGLFEGRSPDDPLRVWVAGCSTGEEAYSIAMLLHEAAHARGFPVDAIKVFATDVHPGYLLRAGKGSYSPDQFAPVPAALRERYFVLDDATGRFVVRTSLRSTIVFARHDLLHDPPFTRIDLVTCRNVLIYLRAHAQQRVIERLLTALVPGGWLFLGPSESIGPLERLLDVVDRRERVYRSRGGVLRPFTPEPTELVTRRPLGPAAWSASIDGPGYLQVVYQQVLDRFVPACVLLDANLHVVHVFGDAARFIEMGPGRAGLDVMRIIRSPMRGALAAALHRCRELGEAVVHRAVATGDSEAPVIDLRVEQLAPQVGASRRYTGVGFIESMQTGAEIKPPPAGEAVDGQLYSELRAELDFTREHLSATTEELTASNEELQATNEELLAANEELQSTNEELQSTNEELYTVNSEFRRKNNELTQLNIDVDNLLRSSDIGAVFVDMAQRVRKFTPAAARLLNLLPQDIERPFDHLAPTVGGSSLAERVDEVLRSGEAWSREWALDDGQVILVRCLPNRDEGDDFDGAVITFTDVTPVARARSAQRVSETRLGLFAEHVPFILWLGDAHTGAYLFVSAAFTRIWGRPIGALETLVQRTLRFVHPDDRAIYGDHLERMATGQIAEVEYRVQREDGRQIWLRTRSFPIRDGAQAIFGGLTEDVTEARRHAAVVDSLRREKERLASLRDVVLEATDDGIAMFDRGGRLVFANRAFCQLAQVDAAEAGHADDLLPGGLQAVVTDALRRNSPLQGEQQVRFPGRASTFDYTVNPVRDERWRASHAVLILRDVGDRTLSRQPARYEQLRGAIADVRRALGDELDGSEAVRAALSRLDDVFGVDDDADDRPVDLAAVSWALEGSVERGLPVSARLVTVVPQVGVRVPMSGDDARRMLGLLFEHVLGGEDEGAISRVRLAVSAATPPPDLRAMSRPALEPDGKPMACVEVSDDGAGRERGLIKGVLSADGPGADPGFDALVELVETHGGACELRSVLGSGTTRRVWLPLAEGAIVERQARRRSPMVLVADDSDEVRQMAAQELGRDFDLDEAADGLAALRRFRTAAVAIDALVLDVEMPGPSARVIFRELRALQPELPVVLISAYPDDLEDAGIPADEACAPLLRPWRPGALTATLERLLEQRRQAPTKETT